MPREDPERRDPAIGEPATARLYALSAAAFLCLLGVLGFFFDASFGSGDTLTSDDLSGILLVNGWRNLLYLVSGILALYFAARAPRATALALGAFYLALGIWGLAETERSLGSILDLLPLANRDNALHLILGGLGLAAGLLDGGLPKLRVRRTSRPTKLPARNREPGKPDAKRRIFPESSE